MTTVIRDTIIATCDPDGRILYDGAIAIDDNGIIAAVGPSDEVVRAYPTADMIPARGKAVYPGFFNCHTHLTATLSRGILEDLGFPSPSAVSGADCRHALRRRDAGHGTARRNRGHSQRHHNVL